MCPQRATCAWGRENRGEENLGSAWEMGIPVGFAGCCKKYGNSFIVPWTLPFVVGRMGNIAECGAGGDKDAARRNKQIENMLAKERRSQEEEVKLLLLGTGGSGKSTIAKQMKIIHLAGFSDEEKSVFRGIVYQNVINAIQILITESEKKDTTPEDGAARNLIMGVALTSDAPVVYTTTEAEAVESLWRDSVIRATFARSREFQLDDSAKYFLDNCTKFASPDYKPDEMDILRARLKTTGIVEIFFVVNKKNFILVDVGGQRNERKKWIHCFQDFTVIIFCVEMNE